MVVKKINVREFVKESSQTIDSVEGLECLKNLPVEVSENLKDLTTSFRTGLSIIEAMADRFAKNSSNSSTPPSSDKNRKKDKDKTKDKEGEKKKPGGQPGHEGATLKKSKNPDKVVEVPLDKGKLPKGKKCKKVGHEVAQVHDVEISVKVTEYRAEVWEDEDGNRYVADFPEGVKSSVQYGHNAKCLSVYMSIFQLIPLARVGGFLQEPNGSSPV